MIAATREEVHFFTGFSSNSLIFRTFLLAFPLWGLQLWQGFDML